MICYYSVTINAFKKPVLACNKEFSQGKWGNAHEFINNFVLILETLSHLSWVISSMHWGTGDRSLQCRVQEVLNFRIGFPLITSVLELCKETLHEFCTSYNWVAGKQHVVQETMYMLCEHILYECLDLSELSFLNLLLFSVVILLRLFQWPRWV